MNLLLILTNSVRSVETADLDTVIPQNPPTQGIETKCVVTGKPSGFSATQFTNVYYEFFLKNIIPVMDTSRSSLVKILNIILANDTNTSRMSNIIAAYFNKYTASECIMKSPIEHFLKVSDYAGPSMLFEELIKHDIYKVLESHGDTVCVELEVLRFVLERSKALGSGISNYKPEELPFAACTAMIDSVMTEIIKDVGTVDAKLSNDLDKMKADLLLYLKNYSDILQENANNLKKAKEVPLNEQLLFGNHLNAGLKASLKLYEYDFSKNKIYFILKALNNNFKNPGLGPSRYPLLPKVKSLYNLLFTVHAMKSFILAIVGIEINRNDYINQIRLASSNLIANLGTLLLKDNDEPYNKVLENMTAESLKWWEQNNVYNFLPIDDVFSVNQDNFAGIALQRISEQVESIETNPRNATKEDLDNLFASLYAFESLPDTILERTKLDSFRSSLKELKLRFTKLYESKPSDRTAPVFGESVTNGPKSRQNAVTAKPDSTGLSFTLGLLLLAGFCGLAYIIYIKYLNKLDEAIMEVENLG